MCFRPPSFDDMMKKCPSCGAFNPPELAKCKKCSTDLPAQAADPNDMPAASAPSAAPKGPGAAPKGPAGPPPAAPKGPAGPPPRA